MAEILNINQNNKNINLNNELSTNITENDINNNYILFNLIINAIQKLTFQIHNNNSHNNNS